MQELIYYVDKNDQPTGETADKLDAHNESTRLHAAFSCYVFNEKGQLLVTQRAYKKKVWPGVWTNTACGHPMPGESREAALKRRLQYELGMTVKDVQNVIQEYVYITPPFNGIIEHEYCPIYAARASSLPLPNPDEVEDYAWIEWTEFVKLASSDNSNDGGRGDWMKGVPKGASRELGIWSWWCKDQLRMINHNSTLMQYIQV